MNPSYDVSWRLSGHQDRLLTCLSISPSGRRLIVASEDKNLLLVDAESGTALVKLCFEGQSAVLCALWYSDDNVIVGCCNGYLYDICFKPTNKECAATMSPILHRMGSQVRWLAFDPTRHLLAIAHGNTVALYVQHNPGRLYLPSKWELLEVVKAPSSDPGGLVHAMFFYPTDRGANKLFIGYAKLGWNIWSDVATVARVSSDTNHNVCNIFRGRAALASDKKSIVVSTLDHSIAAYTLGDEGPNLASLKEYPYQDVEDLSLIVPVASTSDGITLGGMTHGEVPMIESTNGDLSLIRHEEADHLIRVIATHRKKIFIGSSNNSGSILKCYSSSAVIHSAGSSNAGPPAFVTASEALSRWDETDGRWEVASKTGRMIWRLKLSRRSLVWALLCFFILIFALSADPPGGPSFEEAKRESNGTDLFKPMLKRHEYWVVFGVRHFVKFAMFRFRMWIVWMKYR
ncbi:hypothetical protein FRC08_007130 [Ceratobasidium sp. 394]|nr:hypothetical protein FRC08_007130 [Ceratobasidium sp. 394]